MSQSPLKSSLAELLADSRKTVSWPDDVNLDSIPGELVEELKATGKLEIPFVGRFELTEGIVSFAPDSALIVALNTSLESLPVLNVSPGGQVISEDLDVKSFENASETGGRGLSQSKKDDVIPEIELKRPTVSGPVLDKTATVTETQPTNVSRESRKPLRTASRRAAHHHPKRGSGKTAWLVLAGIALIAVAVLLLKPYLFGSSLNETPASLATSDSLSGENLLPVDSTMASHMDSSSVSASGPSTSAAETPSNSNDGIKTISPETKGYTIIVRSALNASAAESIRSELASLDFPMGVLVGENSGIVRYRMALGVFSTALQADSVRISLGNRLPEGSWATRIR